MNGIAQIKAKAAALGGDHSAVLIEDVAQRLEGINYGPPVVTELSRFLRLNNPGLLSEIDRIASLQEEEIWAGERGYPEDALRRREQAIATLVYYYEKLLKLRDNNVEEWDEIDELYIHD